MPSKSHIQHLAAGDIQPETIEHGSYVPVQPPADLKGKEKEVFEFLARKGAELGRYFDEDIFMLRRVAVLTVRCEELESQLGSKDPEVKKESQAAYVKLSGELRNLMAALGATPLKRFDHASRKRGAETYKMNGAARSFEHAEWQGHLDLSHSMSPPPQPWTRI